MTSHASVRAAGPAPAGARTTVRTSSGRASFVGGEGGTVESTAALATRTWAGDAALGAGLVLVALGAEHLKDHPTIGILLVAWAAIEVLWAVLALRGPVPAQLPVLGVLLVGGAGWVLLQPATGTAIGVADAVVVMLQLAAAVLLALHVRLPRHGHGGVGAGRQLVVMAVGALVVAAVTTPGLAATNAGAHAVPHSEHSIGGWGGHHHG